MQSAVRYDGVARDAILRLKHGQHTHVAPAMAALMLPGLLRRQVETTRLIVVPVPLHTVRLRQRRYNQSHLLAKPIARRLDVPCKPAVLVRHRNTESQGSFGRKQRFRNVAGAFTVPSERQTDISGHSILLVDDVYTTGATLSACAKALVKAGAVEVGAVTFARAIGVRQSGTGT
ncbi:hypothetical protein GCM10017044_00260 [Kordiimonas sediminis]|uniref:Phosphoribosyltransferase domain-containing protein n=1 Tax=Kordiimonas sediminis TaxID=1735581 RepID=A0A919E443_9PROT|nr:hypothetical protein GCM10017044_00260 [Kordiimonas sediminis]